MSVRSVALIVAPLLALLLTAILAQSFPWPLAVTAGVTVWVAGWWVFEPLPAAVTALLPLGLFPLFGVLDGNQVAQAYGHPVILLLAGGFMLSAGIEGAGAHRRLALGKLRLSGAHSARRVQWGFVLASGLLSMWISNTATVLVLTPVALAILGDKPDPKMAAPLILAIAYSASVGGMGTPIGTPPNLIFRSVYQEATGTEIGFLSWFKFSIPVLLLVLPFIAWRLGRNLDGPAGGELPVLGPWRAVERRAVACFALVAVAWVTRTEPFGGWSGWLGLPGANDASVALLGVVLMSVLPDGEGDRVLKWSAAERIPWGTLVLFGGGLALASGFASSGLGELLASSLVKLDTLPLWIMLLSICLAVSFLTEITSNTATTALLMPILAATAVAIDADPALLMLPAALAASMAFMLPVATAPNAIAYGTGVVPASRMMREGIVIDVFGVLAVSSVVYAVFSHFR